MNNENKSPLQVFVKECPDVQQAYAGFINSLIGLKALDAKTKQLIYIAMKIVSDDDAAIKAHIPMAKNAGATREEIKAVIQLSISVIGLKAVNKFLPQALEAYDNC